MTFLQHKKQNYFRYSVLAVFSAAVIMLAVIFLKVKGAETLVFKLFSKANFLRPLAIGQNNQESVLLLAKISDLEKENQLLRESVGLGGGYIFSEALYINEGSGSEIHAGDIVLSPEKIFVGKISEVGRDWSKIKPFGALGEKIVLRFGPNKEIAVFATGLGRGELSAELPKDTQIMPGETVWLGEKPEYAAGLISEAGKVDGGEIQNIIIKSQLPFGSLLKKRQFPY